MIWTLILFGIIVLLVGGIFLAAKFSRNAGEEPRAARPLVNCRRGMTAVPSPWGIKLVQGPALTPKEPRG
jgi:hypothetical protein